MNGKIVFAHRGAVSREGLDPENPVVYRGITPLPDDSQDSTRIVTNSVSIPRHVSVQLKEIRGKCSLTQAKDGLKNVHLFSERASLADGTERICYLQYFEGALQVSEYGGRRGANYSALYRELRKSLKDKGFRENEDKTFSIREEETGNFVSLVNELLDRQKQGELELRAVDEIDSIVFNKESRLFYYKAYWSPAEKTSEAPETGASGSSENSLQMRFGQMEECIRSIVDRNGLDFNDRAELEEAQRKIVQLKSKLDQLYEVCQCGIDLLDKVRLLGSQAQ